MRQGGRETVQRKEETRRKKRSTQQHDNQQTPACKTDGETKRQRRASTKERQTQNGLVAKEKNAARMKARRGVVWPQTKEATTSVRRFPSCVISLSLFALSFVRPFACFPLREVRVWRAPALSLPPPPSSASKAKDKAHKPARAHTSPRVRTHPAKQDGRQPSG